MHTTTRNIRSIAVVAAAAVMLTASPSAREESPDASQGGADGIKVHGHWVIDIRNSNGSLAAHHEFENALANHLGASTFLNGVLARRKQVGKWRVVLSDQNGQPLKWLVEPGAEFPVQDQVLSVDTPTTGANAGRLVLSGTTTAPRAAQIIFVQTENDDCPPPGSPAPCTPGSFAFSQKSLASAIPVVEGQLIQVTVVYTFQ